MDNRRFTLRPTFPCIRLHRQLWPAIFVVLPFFFLLIPFSCSSLPDDTAVDVVFTANLNGALEDCSCGGDTVGGFARLSTRIHKLRLANPNSVLVDAGDFFSSYPTPHVNKAMLRHLGACGYDAVAVSDQCFVEDGAFYSQMATAELAALPLMSQNLTDTTARFPIATPPLSRRLSGANVHIWSLIDPAVFEFISSQGLRMVPPEQVLEAVPPSFCDENDLQLILFHGRWDAARQLATRFPWVDAILLAHEQQCATDTVGTTVLAEPGRDGEYLGEIKFLRVDGRWSARAHMSAITLALPIDPRAAEIVAQYYQERGF